jgi:5-(carboxyamino)imidazole ribonucleotide mutase
MTNQKIVVIMGSKSDLSFSKKIGNFLDKEKIGVNIEYIVASAHRTPDFLFKKLEKFELTNDELVYITVAGLSDALSGFVAGNSVYPVIACPPDINSSGFKKVYSSVMTPKGVAVLLVAKPENAALAAVKIFSLTNTFLKEKIRGYIEKKKKEVILSNSEITRKE